MNMPSIKTEEPAEFKKSFRVGETVLFTAAQLTGVGWTGRWPGPC